MARVFLLSATPPDDSTPDHLSVFHGLQASAARDRFGVHQLTEDPEAADVILFAETYGAGWHFERVRQHPFTRRFREKCFIYCENPYVIPFLPGVYTGIDRRWASRRTVGGFYLKVSAHDTAPFVPPDPSLPYLFSFMGSIQTASVRQALPSLEHPRGFFRETSVDFQRALRGAMEPAERAEYLQRFTDVMRQSKFVLCPRGLSASSIRLFETLRLGRVPVILSDGWVEPPGPAWKEFSLRIPERQVREVPRILEEREDEAVAMGNRARAAWLEWFAEEVAFHRVTEACLALRAERRWPEEWAHWAAHLQYLRPFHFRRLLRRSLHLSRPKIARARREGGTPLTSEGPAVRKVETEARCDARDQQTVDADRRSL